jgi:hypothetical protein
VAGAVLVFGTVQQLQLELRSRVGATIKAPAPGLASSAVIS